jgi:hypothetical protein
MRSAHTIALSTSPAALIIMHSSLNVAFDAERMDDVVTSLGSAHGEADRHIGACR